VDGPQQGEFVGARVTGRDARRRIGAQDQFGRAAAGQAHVRRPVFLYGDAAELSETDDVGRR